MREQEQSPLDDAQLATLARARAAKRKLRFAGYVALSNVLGLGLCAILSLGFGLLSLSVSPIGLALLALAWNEERGRTLLLGTDVRAPQRLAINQLILFSVVLVYCAHSAYVAWTGPSLFDAVLLGHPELPEALGDGALGGVGTSVDELSEWGRVVTLIVYAAIAVGCLLVQGLTALYYRSLAPTVAALAAAPPWARELS
jgi:hypothetical protein